MTATVHALLADGRTVEIRPARPQDRDEVLRMHREMSAEDQRLRFFAVNPRYAQDAAERICAPEHHGYQALLAVADERVVGVAEYTALPTRPAEQVTAEIALAVAEGHHGQGIGTLLLEHLVHAARTAGVSAFTAEALAENRGVLKVFADLGLRTSRRFEGTDVRCTVHLEEDEHYLSAVDRRGRIADVASLGPLLRPRSVAVAGAGRRPGSVGRSVLANLRSGGFTGVLYAVNPHAHVIDGTPASPSVAALPRVPDLVVLAVPAPAVPGVAEECGVAGVHALVVLTAGLDGDQAEALFTSCRRHGMRLVGPNCLGIANTAQDTRLNATFAAHPPLSGTAGVAVQSGGVGIALLERYGRLGVGVSTFVSLGDKYDVSGNDMLQWWESDPGTRFAVLHLESFGNPRAFSRTARRVARAMPVLTVDAGRSEAGRRAAASHTAAAATPTMTRRALFTQAGIIATQSISELVDTTALLYDQPLPTGTRVVVVSNAGGAGVLAADACADAGLTVPALDPDLAATLRAGLPPGAATANPVDTTAAVTADRMRWCVDLLASHAAVDAVLLVLVPTALATGTADDPLLALTGAPGRRPRPVAAILLDQEVPVRLLPSGDRHLLPAYAEPRSAARALAHAAHYARWRAEPPGTIPQLSGTDPAGATAIVEDFLTRQPGGGWPDPRTCAALLDRYGIPQVPWAWAADEETTVAAARRLTGEDGGRVALKAYWPGLVHKSDQGALRLDLEGTDQVRCAYRELAARFSDRMTGTLIQSMARRGVELFAGVVQDEVFGPLVLFGLGGTATELLADHAARLAPLTDRDAHSLLTAPRCAPLLFGYRGGEPVDLEGLEQLLLRLSRMACDLPQLTETDLNPVVARPDGVMALDVRLHILPRHPWDPYLRRLRATRQWRVA
ncbi:bifunctional GNAT family N-acetyltransferase/acetate--CoA ligase family protein [Streptomyces sp. HD1123-B1]|uniref:bifunctional acetate--CoA ligase family protein/GNAT family N-acetyltransferase n=1 Tax=Streptomyces huangiella TaxID=3228804 RepID=UPI003D7EB87F